LPARAIARREKGQVSGRPLPGFQGEVRNDDAESGVDRLDVPTDVDEPHAASDAEVRIVGRGETDYALVLQVDGQRTW
jgi:hypothetical protein